MMFSVAALSRVILAPSFLVRLTRSLDSCSKNERLMSSIVVDEVDCVSEVVELDWYSGFIDKGGELGDEEFVGGDLLVERTSDREGVRRVSAKRRILGGISTELLRERDGVGGSVDGRRRVSIGLRLLM